MNPSLQQTWQTSDVFRPGITVFECSPAERTIRHMLFLVAYDIREPRRLRRVAKVCEDYGLRVEYSVFELDATLETFNELWNRLLTVIDLNEDALVAYRICRDCASQIQSLGTVKRPGQVLLYIV